jgi:hypothetical protein
MNSKEKKALLIPGAVFTAGGRRYRVISEADGAVHVKDEITGNSLHYGKDALAHMAITFDETRKTPEAQRRAVAKYQAGQRQVMIKLDREKEADIIEWLTGKESMQAYIKSLIRQDMKRKGEA